MFREMRRPKQALGKEEVIEILENGKTCVMAFSGDNDYPYAVPLNYVYKDNSIYFHCGNQGHKIDAIKRNDKVSFCVIAQDKIDAKELNTDFISVMAFGRARILSENSERMQALELIGGKYSSEFPKEVAMGIEKDWDRVTLVEVKMESMTGKKGSGLV